MSRFPVMLFATTFLLQQVRADEPLPKVGPVPKAARQDFKLDAYYSKYATHLFLLHG